MSSPPDSTDVHITKQLLYLLLMQVLLAELKGSGTYFAIKALKKDVVLEDNDTECTMLERRVLELGSQCPYLTFLHSSFQSPVDLSAASCSMAADYLLGCVCLYLINFYKHDISETSLWIFAEFIANISPTYCLGSELRLVQITFKMADFQPFQFHYC